MYTNLHAFVAPALITVTLISLWRRLLVLVLALLVTAVAVGLYEIFTYIRH
jgi:uncharacterized membrane protein